MSYSPDSLHVPHSVSQCEGTNGNMVSSQGQNAGPGFSLQTQTQDLPFLLELVSPPPNWGLEMSKSYVCDLSQLPTFSVGQSRFF